MKNNMGNDSSKLLREESITKLLVQFSIPAIIGMLVNALYNVVDRIFVGQFVGNIGIGAIFVSSPLSLILMAFAMLVGVGGNSLSSIRLGQGRKEDSDRILSQSLTLSIILSTILMVLGLVFLEPLLVTFGSSKEMLPYAINYTKIILYGAPLQFIGFALNNFIRGEGNPKIAMFTMLIGAFTNIILDYVFIKYLDMGIEGAAWATLIGQGLSMIWVLYYFLRGNSLLKVRKEYLKLNFPLIREIFSLGFSPFSMQLAASMVTMFLNTSLSKYGGDIAVSSMGIINGITMLILMPIFGINQGAQPVIGFNHGANQPDRVKEALFKAMAAATFIALLGFIMIRTIPEKLFLLFLDKNDNISDILAVGIEGLKYYLLLLPIIGAQIVSTNYFQATGKPRQAAILGLSRQVLILIPAILILSKMFGLKGVWIATPVSDFGATLLTLTFLIKDLKSYK